MSLYQKLQEAKSEEDVKDIYIKVLGLKDVSRNLIDIQTKEIWFEAKRGSKESIYAMFTQLLHYVQDALNEGEYVPPFLAVIDSVKAAIMKTADVIPFLEQKTIQWSKSASDYTHDALDAINKRQLLFSFIRDSVYGNIICSNSGKLGAWVKFTITKH